MEFSNFGFFSYKPNTGDVYRYTADEFSTILGGLCGDGVNVKYGDGFAATTSATGVTLGSGMLWIKGHCAWNDAPVTLTVAESGVICAHLDNDNSVVELVVVDAETAADADYLPLYNVNVDGGAITVTDTRAWNYGSANYPAARVVYADTQPAYEPNAIWLKPVQ